jgi:hypothetical protein
MFVYLPISYIIISVDSGVDGGKGCIDGRGKVEVKGKTMGFDVVFVS